MFVAILGEFLVYILYNLLHALGGVYRRVLGYIKEMSATQELNASSQNDGINMVEVLSSCPKFSNISIKAGYQRPTATNIKPLIAVC